MDAASEIDEVDHAAEAAIVMAEGQMAVLAELAQIGLRLARAVADRAERVASGQADDSAAAGDPGLVFSRIAQAVRRTIALEARLAEGKTTQGVQLFKQRAARRTAAAQDHHDHWQNQLGIHVRDAMDATHPDADIDAVDRLWEHAVLCLDGAEDFSDYLDRPIGETVARLCHELGLDPTWSQWDGEAWVIKVSPTRLVFPGLPPPAPWARPIRASELKAKATAPPSG